MSAHTPGPWITRDRNIWWGDILLAKVYKQGEEGEENARLIAAAPDLKNELEAAWEAMDRAANVLADMGNGDEAEALAYRAHSARAAIAKARGE